MLPNNQLNIIEDEYGLSIRFAWFSPIAIFLAFFCLVWDGFLVLWYSLALSGSTSLLSLIFPILHVAVGVGLTYYTLCLFFNKTYIDVNDQHLWIHHGPIPWWKGNTDVSVEQLEQVFVQQQKHQGKNGTSYTYEVVAQLKNGDSRKLLDIGVTDSKKALALEKLIENYLGINDSLVSGAYGSVRPAIAEAARPEKDKTDTTEEAGDNVPQTTDQLPLDSPDTLDLNAPSKEILREWDEEDLV